MTLMPTGQSIVLLASHTGISCRMLIKCLLSGKSWFESDLFCECMLPCMTQRTIFETCQVYLV